MGIVSSTRTAVFGALVSAVMLSAVGVATADFILWDDEELTVPDGHHDQVLSYDRSQAYVCQGASVSRLHAYNTARAELDGYGEVWELNTWDNATVVSKGPAFPQTYHSIHQLNTYQSSTAYIRGGSPYDVDAYDSSTLQVTGGGIDYVYTKDNSTARILGGSIDTFRAYDNSSVDFWGGSVRQLCVDHSSTVVFHTLDFRVGGGISLDGDRVMGTGFVSAEGLDGTRWAVEVTRNTGMLFLIAHLPGDANRDDRVDLDDFGILKYNFGTTSGATWAMGDFDGRGSVNLTDFSILKQNFGTTAVPEPAALSLLAFGGLTLRRRRR